MRDVFDLSRIDADTFAAGQQSFSYIGTAAFSGTAAQVRYYQDPSTNLTYVQAKLAGETSADMTIAMNGLYTLSASNFALTPAASASAVAAAKALKVVNTQSNGVYESNYTGVIGKPYADYQTFALGGKLAAMNMDYGTASSITSNGLEIAQTGVTLTRSATEGHPEHWRRHFHSSRDAQRDDHDRRRGFRHDQPAEGLQGRDDFRLRSHRRQPRYAEPVKRHVLLS